MKRIFLYLNYFICFIYEIKIIVPNFMFTNDSFINKLNSLYERVVELTYSFIALIIHNLRPLCWGKKWVQSNQINGF
jgi:hypothetical protein